MSDAKIEIVLEQWKTCVEMSNSVSSRRDAMNNIFTTLNLAIIAAAAFTWNTKTVLLFVAGSVACVLWLFTIRNYKLLNTEKFKVINDLEKMLPKQPFNDEWAALSKNHKYMESTKLEKGLPITFMIIYGVSLLVLIKNACG